MPTRCVIPGCKSYMESGVSFFKPPMSIEKRTQWEESLNLELDNKKHHVCEWHFKEDDIQREKLFYRTDNTILGTARYMRPRLRNEAIPSLSPQVDEVSSKHSRKRSHHDEVLENIPVKKVTPNPTKAVYNIIKAAITDISLPSLWSKIDLLDIDDIVYASFLTNSTSNIVTNKEVRLDKNGNVTYRCCGKKIKIDATIHTSNDLAKTIHKFDSEKICAGVLIKKSNPNDYKDLSMYRDTRGVLRHNLCPMLLLDTSLTFCRFCSN